MAITRLGGANAITGTLPAANINNTSIGNITSLPAAIATGKVLQVVQGTTTYSKTNSSTSFTDVESSSGVSWVTSITPSSTSSKILITAYIGTNVYESGSSEGDQRCNLQMLGDINGAGYSTLSGTHKGGGYAYGGSSYGVSIGDATPFIFLWTPNTTSQCNVKFQFHPTGNNGYVDVVGTGGQINSCNLLEVSG